MENSELSDEQLVLAAKRGDLAAFEQLVRRHSEALFAFIYRLVGNQSDTEELVQETWVRAWQGIGGFQQRSGFKTWLFRIGMNLTFNLKTRRKPTEELTELLPAGEISEPAVIYQRRCREEAIRAALGQLPPDQRTALVLSVYQEMSYKEIARVMGRSVRAVDSLLVRAKSRLREILGSAREKGVI